MVDTKILETASLKVSFKAVTKIVDPIEQVIQGHDGNYKLIYYSQRDRGIGAF